MPQPIDMKRFAQLKNAGDLPSPRGVALAIIRLTQSSDVSLAELGRVIKGDPAFVGRLIKTANGMVADGRRAVVSVQDALMVLGLPAVRSLALGFSLLSNYRKGACKGFDYEQFWSSSLLMALAMQTLAQRVRVVAPDEAFSLGLLGRIGELALATLYPEAFGRLLGELQRSPGLQQAALEDQAFAMNHRELGAAMLADWGIPEALVQPVRFYEQPELAGFAEQSREEGLVQCLVLARAIARFSMVPEQEHASLLPPMLRLSSRLGFARADFVSLCERIGRTWREWGKLLHLKTGELPDFDRLAAASEAALIEAAPAHGGASAAASTDGPPRRALLMSRDGGEEAALGQLRAGLAQAGLDSFEAHEAGAALEQVVDLQPQVAVVVWCAEGARFVRSLREMRLGRGVHVLAVVSDDEAMLAAALAAGADDFLVAPLTGLQVSLRLRGSLRALELKDELERERETARHFAAEAAICNRRLHEAALIDVLTGLPNRRQATEAMRAEWAGAVRHRRPLSVIVVDLDDFGSINGLYGHDVGDIALRHAAGLLRAALRLHDQICRTGGDEFFVLCPDTALDGALLVAERLRNALQADDLDTGGPVLSLSASVGVAERVAAMQAVEELARCAETGARLAKQRGRNRVVAPQREAPGAAGHG